MSTRLKVRVGIACVALVVFVIVKLINPSRVTFSPANMSIDPGKGWKQVTVTATPASCSPRLVSKSGVIGATVLDEEVTEIRTAAEKLQANVVSSGKAPTDAIKQEDFTTASGLAGIHISYTGKTAKSDTPDVRSHHFITRNMRGRCVTISYVASPEQESSELVAAITKTLRVE